MSLFISTISTNYRRVPLDSLLYDLLRMRQPAVTKTCLTSRERVEISIRTLSIPFVDNILNYLPIDGRPQETDPDTDRAVTPAIRMRFECDPTVIQMQAD